MSVFMSVGKKLAEGAQTRLARARDTNYTTDTYHGSTHDLTEMDASKTNVEGDWGQGIYSSSNIDDVNENYAGVGPDLTARIEQQRERLQDDILDEIETNGLETTLQRYSELLNDSVSTNFINDIKKYRDNDEGFAKDLADIVATKQIKGSNDGVVYPLKQNTDGFATIGGKDRTIVEGRDYHAEAREEIKRSDYGDEYDYEDAVEEYAFDLMNSDYDTNYQKVLEVIDRRGGGVSVDDLADAFEGDSVDLTKLDEIIRKSQIYAEDDAGNFIPNGAVSAEILQNLGFKGVIDNTANAKFGSARDRGRPMDGMDEDTVHYITFEGAENQIRSRNAQFKDPTSKNILAGSAATAVGAGTVLAPQDAQAGFFSQAVKAAGNLQRKTGNAAGFKNDLTGKGQVKPDELKAMGFDEHFGDRADITKEEVQQFINDNQVQIKETVLGKPLEDRYVVRPDPEGGFNVYDATDSSNEVLDSYGRQETAASAAATMNKNENVDTSKFGDYTLEGGDNYRELLLQDNSSAGLLDEINSLNKQIGDAKVALRNDQSALLNVAEDMQREADKFIGGDNTKENYDNYQRVNRELSDFQDGKPLSDEAAGKYIYGAKELIERRDELVRQKANLPEPFINSSHFDEPNILAHLRMKDRVDTDGNKTLLIEEAQSDWHQKGANDGYRNAPPPPELALIKAKAEQAQNDFRAFLEKNMDLHAPRIDMERYEQLTSSGEGLRLKEIQKAAVDELMNGDVATKYNRELIHAVPDAPFKTDDKSSWYNLAMKRGLIEAAEGDYDKLAITPGRQQAERYDLSKTIGSLKYQEDMVEGRPVNILTAYDKQGMRVFNRRIDDPEKELPSIIGKDAAKSLLEVEPYTPPQETRSIRSLRGQELSVGGEGMKEFYDRKLPNTLNKLVKQDGVKVGQTTLDHPHSGTGLNRDGFTREEVAEIERLQDLVDRDYASEIDREYLANYLAREKPYGDTVHSIDITPEMRDRVKKGLPLFAQGGAVVGAGALFSPDQAQAGASAEQQKFERLEAEEQKLRAMRSSSFGKVSSELAAYRRSQLLPSIGTLAQGAARDTAKGLDYISPANLTRLLLDPADEGFSRFMAKPISDRIAKGAEVVTQPMLYDEDDPYSKKRKQDAMDLGGMLFSPL